MTTTTENMDFKPQITLELQRGLQIAKLVTLVYENPTEPRSDVHFELKDYDDTTVVFHCKEQISKETFISISRSGRLKYDTRYGDVSCSDSEFYFHNRDRPSPIPQRYYMLSISVPQDQKKKIWTSGLNTEYGEITVTRLPNTRLSINWRFWSQTKDLIIECPRTRDYARNDEYSTVQLVTKAKDSKMKLGSFDKEGDSFPIKNIDQQGSVIIPLDPKHSSMIGIYYLNTPITICSNFVLKLPKMNAKSVESF